MRTRPRWETIIPAAALLIVSIIITIFASDFDRITGRTTATTTVPAASPETAAAPTDADAIVKEAASLVDQGLFAQAITLLTPIGTGMTPNAEAAALLQRATDLEGRDRRLMAALAKQRAARSWPAVISTINLIEQGRPLSSQLVQLRASARSAIVVSRAATRARALMRDGRYTQAATVLDAALAQTRSPLLQQLRSQVSAAQSGPAKSAAPAARGSSAGGSGTTGARQPARPPMPPAVAGGGPPQAASRPPTAAPTGAQPPRPSLPNPVTTGPSVSGGGAPAAAPAASTPAPAAGSNCHEHDGVFECH
jgi:hypothetical protein